MFKPFLSGVAMIISVSGSGGAECLLWIFPCSGGRAGGGDTKGSGKEREVTDTSLGGHLA